MYLYGEKKNNTEQWKAYFANYTFFFTIINNLPHLKKNCIYLQQCHFKGYGILKDMDMAAQNFIIQLSNAFGQ